VLPEKEATFAGNLLEMLVVDDIVTAKILMVGNNSIGHGFMKCHKHIILGLFIYFCEECYTLLMMQYYAIALWYWCALWSLDH
jgi:hypothetical protein